MWSVESWVWGITCGVKSIKNRCNIWSSQCAVYSGLSTYLLWQESQSTAVVNLKLHFLDCSALCTPTVLKNYSAMRCTTQHCTALNWTPLHCTALHFSPFHFPALHCTAHHSTPLHDQPSNTTSLATCLDLPSNKIDMAITEWISVYKCLFDIYIKCTGSTLASVNHGLRWKIQLNC